eukprot:3718789-Rhodomonas_salina.3
MSSEGVLRGLVRIPLEDHESDALRLKVKFLSCFACSFGMPVLTCACCGLKVAAENTNDRLYVMVEGDWGQLSRQQVQKRLLFIYDELNRANNKLDARVLLPAPKAHLAPHALGIEAVFSSPEEGAALDSWNEQRKANSLPPIAKRPSTAPCPPSLQSLCWGAETCENVPRSAPLSIFASTLRYPELMSHVLLPAGAMTMSFWAERLIGSTQATNSCSRPQVPANSSAMPCPVRA